MEKDALVINLFGGPGVGKSTTAAGVFSLLKLHDIECELVPEFAKDLVWEERFKTFKDQQYIFGKQHHRLWRVKDQVDVVVTDCPLMLSIIYGKLYGTTTLAFESNVIDVIKSFKNKNIILSRTKKYNSNGRNETEDQAKEVDEMVKRSLEGNKMPWVDIPGNFQGINEVAKVILKELRISPKFKLEMR